MKVGIVDAATRKAPVMLEVFPTADIGTLKSMIEVELRIPYVRQSLTIPGKYAENQIRDQDTLQGLNLAEGEIIIVKDRGAEGASPMQPVANALLEQSSKEKGYLAKLKQYQPELAAAVEKRDIKAATTALTNLLNRKKHGRGDEGDHVYSFRDTDKGVNDGVAYVQAVPYYLVQPYQYDPYAQPLNPALSQVQKSLLFVSTSINGLRTKALIDCAAQISTISENYAGQCNLLSALDTRYQGFTGGQGSAPTVGRLHQVDIIFPPNHKFTCSLSVVRSSTACDVVLGLDFFKRHQCCIDLRYNCLRIGDTVTLPFLNPEQIQASINEDILKSLLHQQPTDFGGVNVMDHSARSSTYNFTMDSVARPPGQHYEVPTNQGGPNYPHQEPYTPLGTTHQARLNPPATSPPPVQPSGRHLSPQNNPRQPSPQTQPQQSETLELNVNRSRRIHQQAFDDKNVGGKLIEETKIRQLTELGFKQEQAQQALRKCKGDTELAAAYLFQSTARI